MPVPKKILNYLDSEKARYEIVEHRTVFTAWDAAATMHVKPQQIVKTLVVKLRGKVPALVLLPANKNLDKKKFADVAYSLTQKAIKDPESVPKEWSYPSPDLKGKSYPVEFAKEKWMKEKMLGKIGATPAFGRAVKLPVFMDKSMLKEKELIFNSGDYNFSIKMKSQDFVKLENPLTGTFAVKK
jgi:prolyl-tRNA editing enzyme YbaK/EbsC (Cys-tRNA(Pro) deacylase)